MQASCLCRSLARIEVMFGNAPHGCILTGKCHMVEQAHLWKSGWMVEAVDKSIRSSHACTAETQSHNWHVHIHQMFHCVCQMQVLLCTGFKLKNCQNWGQRANFAKVRTSLVFSSKGIPSFLCSQKRKCKIKQVSAIKLENLSWTFICVILNLCCLVVKCLAVA